MSDQIYLDDYYIDLLQDQSAAAPDPEDRDPLEGYQLQPKEGKRIKLISLDEVEEKELEWLIPGYIVKDTVNILFGAGGDGKTFVWCGIAAAISTGKPCFLEGLEPLAVERKPGMVLCFSGEDQLSTSIKKRIRMAGADLKYVKSLEISNPDFKNIRFGKKDLEYLIEDYRPVLMIFDPLQAFVSRNTQMGSRNDMRQELNVLLGYGEKYHVTTLIVCHTNKRSGVGDRNRLADSADIWDLARNALAVGKTPNEGIRYISHEKCSGFLQSKTVLFQITGNRAVFHSTSPYRDKYYQDFTDYKKPAPTKEACIDRIVSFLAEAEEPVPVSELNEHLEAFGFKGGTISVCKTELSKAKRIRIFSKGNGTENSPKAHYAELLKK